MNEELTKQDIKRNEVADAMEGGLRWVRLHPQQTLWGALAAAALVLVSVAVVLRRHQTREEAWSGLSAATAYAYSGQTDAALGQVKAVADAHAGTTAAAYARLLAGDILFQQGKFKEAAQAYQEILAQPGDAATPPLALSGLALAQEGSGDCPAAAASAQRFLDSHQDHYLAPQTHAVLARCLASQGKAEEAKAAFQRIEILYPGTYWETWAKARK
jgi:tetratricopeptide (TPR) repeat protein